VLGIIFLKINFQPFWKGRGDFWGMGKVGITIAPKLIFLFPIWGGDGGRRRGGGKTNT
jgi:hypothetical protein